ncbi:hypothetical protein CPB84DRAFT_859826 [Gymnopilus junonius]|uniref:Uncharacterized protein n=1 Tax=Gymnopilus junonius TaxID=109634 RepID=A0A9P5TPA5_GYMJU|nr:hypothetical protein CPB84DRAFT_859826 [Gymnopilus junonius]
MIRKEWKPREQKDKDVDMKTYRGEEGMNEDEEEEGDEEEEEEEEEGEESAETEEDDEEETADLEATPRMLPRTTGIHSPQSSVSSSSRGTAHPRQTRSPSNNNSNNNMASLTSSLNSLTLVPNSVRFNRGAKGGFTQLPRGTRGRGRSRSGSYGGAVQGHNTRHTELDHPPPATTFRGRGGGVHADAGHADIVLGARSRGRGRVVPHRAGGRGGGRAKGFER